MSVRTKKGDDGTSSIFDGKSRIPKDHPIFEALGSVDELNSYLGFPKLLSHELSVNFNDKTIYDIIDEVQDNLFIVQAELAGANGYSISEQKVEDLTQLINKIEEDLPPMREFFKSGALELSSHFDYSRTLARKAERRIITAVNVKVSGVNIDVNVRQFTRAYMNGLSDLLFVLARLSNHLLGGKEKNPTYK